MKITVLGTGTSQGVPVIGCACAVCHSDDPCDNRLRSSILISDASTNVVIDAGPDFRQQMLRARVQHLDAIVLTHEHNDHVIGLDDIRPFNHRSGRSIDVYALPRVGNEVKKRFEYVFSEYIPGLPRIALRSVELGCSFDVGHLRLEPIGVMHGKLPIIGIRCGDFAYLTDVKTLEPTEALKLKGVKTLIINALHHDWHPTHMNLAESLAMIDQLKPEQAWLTHISHHMGLSRQVESLLPSKVHLAFDGLQLDI